MTEYLLTKQIMSIKSNYFGAFQSLVPFFSTHVTSAITARPALCADDITVVAVDTALGVAERLAKIILCVAANGALCVDLGAENSFWV